MRVVVTLEIETPDYDGKIFMKEIEELIADIRKETCDSESELHLTYFHMREKSPNSNNLKSYEWELK